jgi:hypothetical protein
MIRIVIAGPVCALGLLCGYSPGAHASTHAVDPAAKGVLRGVVGRGCEATWRRGVPPKVRVSVRLSRGSRVVAHTTLTLSSRGGRPFSFTEPVGHYTVSASNGTRPQVVVITAGKTTNVRLEMGSHAICA